jgi:hypothetical protein
MCWKQPPTPIYRGRYLTRPLPCLGIERRVERVIEMTLHSKAGREAMQRFSWQFLVSSESPERESFGLQSAQASITLAFIPYPDAILLSASESRYKLFIINSLHQIKQTVGHIFPIGTNPPNNA